MSVLVGLSIGVGAAILSQGMNMATATVPVPDIEEKEYKRYTPVRTHLSMHSGSSIPVTKIERVGNNAYQVHQLNGGMFDIHTYDLEHYMEVHNVHFVGDPPEIKDFQTYNKRPNEVHASMWRNANKRHGRRRDQDKGRKKRAKGAGGR